MDLFPSSCAVSKTFHIMKELNYSPLTRCLHHSMSHITYLIFFAYFLIISSLHKHRKLEEEFLLFAYWATFTLDEVKQWLECENRKHRGKEYLSSSWNLFDIVIIITRFLTIGYRITYCLKNEMVHSEINPTSPGSNEVYPKSADIQGLYAGVFVLEAVRILQILLIGKIFGPILLMVGQMFKDLRNVLLILLVFLLAYGVTLFSVNFSVKPDLMKSTNYAPLKILIKCPFYHLFGEYFTDGNDTLCWPEKGQTDNIVVNNVLPTLRGLYLLVCVVLLLNLLIAMFNSSIIKVEARSERLWYLHRRKIIFENWKRSIFPFAPFLLSGNLIILVRHWYRKYCSTCSACCQDKAHFQKKMLSITPRNEEGKEWLAEVMKWERLIHRRAFPAVETEISQKGSEGLSSEPSLCENLFSCKLRELRKFTSYEISTQLTKLKMDIAADRKKRFDRMQAKATKAT